MFEKEATTTVQWECTPMIDRPTFINGYITGAEPREKRIAELENKLANADYQLEGRDNEIAELKEELNYAKSHCLFHSDCPTQKENAELKKENENLASIAEHQQSSNMKRYFEIAELKKACDETQELLDKQIEATYKLDKENAKAKEIIKKFLLWENAWHNKTESKYELLKQAEQFLNSEVGK